MLNLRDDNQITDEMFSTAFIDLSDKLYNKQMIKAKRHAEALKNFLIHLKSKPSVIQNNSKFFKQSPPSNLSAEITARHYSVIALNSSKHSPPSTLLVQRTHRAGGRRSTHWAGRKWRPFRGIASWARLTTSFRPLFRMARKI